MQSVSDISAIETVYGSDSSHAVRYLRIRDEYAHVRDALVAAAPALDQRPTAREIANITMDLRLQIDTELHFALYDERAPPGKCRRVIHVSYPRKTPVIPENINRPLPSFLYLDLDYVGLLSAYYASCRSGKAHNEAARAVLDELVQGGKPWLVYQGQKISVSRLMVDPSAIFCSPADEIETDRLLHTGPGEPPMPPTSAEVAAVFGTPKGAAVMAHITSQLFSNEWKEHKEYKSDLQRPAQDEVHVLAPFDPADGPVLYRRAMHEGRLTEPQMERWIARTLHFYAHGDGWPRPGASGEERVNYLLAKYQALSAEKANALARLREEGAHETALELFGDVVARTRYFRQVLEKHADWLTEESERKYPFEFSVA